VANIPGFVKVSGLIVVSYAGDGVGEAYGGEAEEESVDGVGRRGNDGDRGEGAGGIAEGVGAGGGEVDAARSSLHQCGGGL